MIASNIEKFAASDQSCFSRPATVCWPTLDKDLFRHPRLQPTPFEAAGRAWHAAADGTVINLIVTSTVLKIRLVQEAHKRKLSAATWFLLLREWGKQKNKSQRYLRLQPAEGKASLSSTAALFVLVCCHGLGMAQYNRPGEDHGNRWLVPQWVWSHRTSPRAPRRQRERVTGVSFCLTSQPAGSSNHFDYLHW